MSLLIRNVEMEGRAGLDVRIDRGRIAEVGPRLPAGGREIDGRGGALIPGLCDHHIHLFALAARAASVPVEDARDPLEFAGRIAAGLARRPAGGWMRVTGYHESRHGPLARADLDRLAPRHPVRVEHQTGSLWTLNGLALAALAEGDDPPGLDRATGRLWRGDAWLRRRLGGVAPPLAPIGRRLAAFGVTAVTDATVTTDAAAAEALAQAHRAGELPQRLTLMSGGPLAAPGDGAFTVGAVKVLLDDHGLPDLDDFIARIAEARAWGRAVAVHCVAAGELALTLAAFEAAGARPGDRIEHGGVIAPEAVSELRRLGLIVVTQPVFVRERGDRYLAEVDSGERADLYRCASLMAAGVPVAASSDAPYGSPDPWLGVAAAVGRRTLGGAVLGETERVGPAAALALYLDDPAGPGAGARRVARGATADLCLLDAPLAQVLAEPSSGRVAATLIGGEVVFERR